MVFLFITPDCKIRVHVFFFLRERKTGDRRWTDRQIDLPNNALRKTIIRTHTHRQRGRDTDRQTDRQADRQTGRPTNNFTEIQRSRQTNRQAKGRQNDLAGDRRKTNLHTDRQTDRRFPSNSIPITKMIDGYNID